MIGVSDLDFVLRAVALTFDADGLGVVQQPVQQGRSEDCVVVEDAGPLLVGSVGRNQGGTALVAVADDLEQAVGAELVDWEVAQFVHAKDGRFDVLVQGTLDAAAGVRGRALSVLMISMAPVNSTE